jgi:hypothetical protein
MYDDTVIAIYFALQAGVLDEYVAGLCSLQIARLLPFYVDLDVTRSTGEHELTSAYYVLAEIEYLEDTTVSAFGSLYICVKLVMARKITIDRNTFNS